MMGKSDTLGFLMIGYALGIWSNPRKDRWLAWFFLFFGLFLVCLEALEP
jgi:hypothetical protein